MHQDYLKNQTCMSDDNSVIFDAIFNDIIIGLFTSFYQFVSMFIFEI